MPTTRIIKILPLVFLLLFARALGEDFTAGTSPGEVLVGDVIDELPIIDRNTNLVMLLEEIRSLPMATTKTAAEIVTIWQRIFPKIDVQQSKIGTKFLQTNLGISDYTAAKALSDDGNTAGSTAAQLASDIRSFIGVILSRRNI